MITEEKKQTIKLAVAITVLVLVLIFVGISVIVYQVEGEKNMPFKLSKIVAVSSAEGIEKIQEETSEAETEKKEKTSNTEKENNTTKKEDTKTENADKEEKAKETESTWNFDICQNNDVYFYIDSNTKDENLLIKSVKIDNIKIVNNPQIGEVKAFMPNSEPGRLYNYEDRYIVNEKLEYKGASQSSYTNLEIGSKGGTAWICFNNMNIGNYTSNKKEEITHDGTWLSKLEISQEQVQFTVSFDLTIQTTKTKYKANIKLDFPTGDISKEGKSYIEKTDMSDIIFKRVK